MIRSIRRRFIRIALAVLALAMVLLALVINAANWVNVRAELTEALGYLSQNGGMFRRSAGGMTRRDAPGMNRRFRGLENRLEESRFFSVMLTENDQLILNDATRETEHSSEELAAIARRALASGRTGGFAQDYLFRVTETGSGRRIAVFLNCETRLDSVRRLALISAAACVAGVLLAWLLVALFSRRAIRPLIENAVRQKQFITDAGHELKTPLTVISANMDVLALEDGENEWVRSTQKQVSNMRGLVNELIYLSRLDEEDVRLQKREFDLSAALAETAEPFVGMAEFAGKTLEVRAGDGIRMTGDEAALRRLISVLCDNAVKYAPEGDTIALTLEGDGRRIALVAENGLKAPLSDEALKHLFDRFYRADASRSRQSGGYGIGLSVARAIAEVHGGGIRARQTDGGRLRFVVSLPANGKGPRHPAS